ncbi:hypothetical protein [Streptomyces sp. CS131]|uniref:hypothetical protein n=1 Tax=Streptomyces sp. CS131 TaxID=2162711 RepID=UPI000D513113|nr:hypothetical protein [Streptomyces sp. CS131]PVC91292.1 hypothetical protein DBP20_02375 [Streptomyces sp. CS131]
MHDPTGNSDDLPFDFGLTGLGGSFRGEIPRTPNEKGELHAGSTNPGRTPSRKPGFGSKGDVVRSTRAARIARGCMPE